MSCCKITALCLVTQDSIIIRHLICEAVTQSDEEQFNFITFTSEKEPAKLSEKRWGKKPTQNINMNLDQIFFLGWKGTYF